MLCGVKELHPQYSVWGLEIGRYLCECTLRDVKSTLLKVQWFSSVAASPESDVELGMGSAGDSFKEDAIISDDTDEPGGGVPVCGVCLFVCVHVYVHVLLWRVWPFS